MTGLEFEKYCADVLKNNGYTGVEVTKASGDQGIDVLAKKGGRKYAVQCKYYSSPVSNSAVQEAYAGKTFYGCDTAMVMTNSTFTKSAKELAERIGVELWENVDSTTVKRHRYGCVSTVVLILAILGFVGCLMDMPKQGLQQDDKEVMALCGILIVVLGFAKIMKRLGRHKAIQETISNGNIEGIDLDSYDGDSWDEPMYGFSDMHDENNSIVDERKIEAESFEDELLPDAIELVVEVGQASVSMLQRRFRVGYNRAARLIVRMEELEIIGPSEGEKPRKVLCQSMSQAQTTYNCNKSNTTIMDEEEEALIGQRLNRVKENIVDETKVLSSLGLKREDNPVPVTEIIPTESTIYIGSTHEQRLELVDRMIMYTSNTENKIVLIDSHESYSLYNGLTNMFIPVVVNVDQQSFCANWINGEHEARMSKILEKGARNKNQYNDRCDEDKKMCDITILVYDVDLDRTFADNLNSKVILHGDITGIHLVMFCNNNMSDIKELLKKGFIEKDYSEL